MLSVTRNVKIDLPSLAVLYLVTYRTLSGCARHKERAEVAKVLKSSVFTMSEQVPKFVVVLSSEFQNRSW